MARSSYGGGADDVIVSEVTISGQQVAGLPAAQTFQVWNLANTVQLTGIVDGVGSALPSNLVTSTTLGQIPVFQGPDGFIGSLRLKHVGTGVSWILDPHDNGISASGMVNVRAFGARGDGTTDDAAAINAAITYAAALGASGTGSAGQSLTGGTVFFPAGVYLHSQTIALKSQVRLMGASREAVTLRRTANVVSLGIYGTGSADVNRNWYASVEHLTIDGDGETATGVDMVYASQVVFNSVFIFNVSGIGMDLVEVWDSQFYSLWMQYCSGIGVTEQPALYVRSKRASSGFGSSVDSSNEIVFTGLHIEHFRAGAVRIGPGFAGYSNGPNGIYIQKLKTESPFISFGEPVVMIEANTERIHLERHYAFCADLSDGGPVTVIQNNSLGMTSLRDIFVANAGVDTISTAVTLSCDDGYPIVDGVYGNYGTAPSTAHVQVDSLFAGSITNLRTNLGTLIANHEQASHSRGKALTSDLTTTSTTTANITGLTFNDVPPGTYRVSLEGLFQSSSTTNGPRFGVGGSATTTVNSGFVTMWTSPTASTTTAMTAWNTAVGTSPAATATSYRVDLVFVMTVTAIGTAGIRWNVNASATGTLKAGAVATLTRL